MANPRRAARHKAQLPDCYHEGFLEKRSLNDKIGRKLWTCLCGSSIFFFNNNKDIDYIEKLDLSDFVSLTDDSSHDQNLDTAKLLLHLKHTEVQLTAPSLEACELWKGFIFSVVELAVPYSLNLLPGQIHLLKEVVAKEKMRRKPLPDTPSSAPAASFQELYLSVPSDMPACYQKVSRGEARLILERNQDKGNMLLRPGRDGCSFAVTTQQELNGPVYKHYLVTRRHEGGFTIAVDKPIHCETLQDVINCLVERTGGHLKPLILEEAYEKNIKLCSSMENIFTFVESDEESGERTIISARSTTPSPVPETPKPAQSSRVPSPQPENEYLKPNDVISDHVMNPEVDQAVVVPPPFQPRIPGKGYVFVMPKVAMNPEVDEEVVAPPPVQPRTSGRLIHQTSHPEGLKISREGALLPPSHPIAHARPRSMSETPQPTPRTKPFQPAKALSDPRTKTSPKGVESVGKKQGPAPILTDISQELKEKLLKRQAALE